MTREEIEHLIADLEGMTQTEPDGTKYHFVKHDDLVDFAEHIAGAGEMSTMERDIRLLSRLSEAVLMDWPCKVDVAKEVASFVVSYTSKITRRG